MTAGVRFACLAVLIAVPFAACQDERPVEQPRILYGEEPIDYPLELYDAAVEGEAVLRVRVDDRGRVDSVEVTESSGHEELDASAVKGLLATRFTPARRGAARVRAWVIVPVRFTTRPRPDDGPGT